MEGLWRLVKIAKGGEKQEPWILFKRRDEFARPKADYDVVSALPDSVIAKPLKEAPAKETSPRRPAQKATTKSSRHSGEARGGVPGAVEAPLPSKMLPQLATSPVPANKLLRRDAKANLLARMRSRSVQDQESVPIRSNAAGNCNRGRSALRPAGWSCPMDAGVANRGRHERLLRSAGTSA